MNITIVGTGYVGLVTGTCFAEMGNNVVCIDNDEVKLEKLRTGNITIYEPGLELLFQRNFLQNRLKFSNNLSEAINSSSVIFLCLPTPQGEDGSADLSYVIGVAKKIGEILNINNEFKVIVNKSTVPVGTAFKVKQIMEEAGAKSFDVASNPEFLREGFAVEDFMKPDRIVIGCENQKTASILISLYNPFVRQGNPIFEMDILSAEVTKYAANSYLATRITFMNELANFCEKVGADINWIRKGIGADSRIGKRFLFPGIGYGGSCFPKDVSALIKTANDTGNKMEILSAVESVNKNQRIKFVQKIKKYFNDDIKNKHFAIWGLSFKPNTDDMREAPSVNIIEELLRLGCSISAFDPVANDRAKYYFQERIEYKDNKYEVLSNSDALIILTEWNEFRNPEFQIIKTLLNTPVIFDGRNVYDLNQMEQLEFDYVSIGRQPIIKIKT